MRKEAYTFSNRCKILVEVSISLALGWSCKFYIYERSIFQYRQVATTIKKSVAGRLCEVLIPIKHEYYIGEGKSVVGYAASVCIVTHDTILSQTNTILTGGLRNQDLPFRDLAISHLVQGFELV